MKTLENKICDTLDYLNIKYSDPIDIENGVEVPVLDQYTFIGLYNILLQSIFSENLTISDNSLIIQLKDFRVFKQPFTITANIIFYFTNGTLSRTLIKYESFRYYPADGNPLVFTDFDEMMALIAEDTRVDAVEIIGEIDV